MLYTVVARVDGEVVKKWTTVASPEGLTQRFLKYFLGADIYTTYEAGFLGFVLHRELEKNGIHNRVVHAAGIEIAPNDRVKTDKRDAHKLSALLEAKRLKGIRIPSEVEENGRQLTRTRQQLVEDRAAIKNKTRMKFHQLGLIEASETRKMTTAIASAYPAGCANSLKSSLSQKCLLETPTVHRIHSRLCVFRRGR